MTTYSSSFVDSIKDGAYRVVKFLSATSEETDQLIGFDEYVWRSIEKGLSYCGGFTYSLYDNKDHMPSLEQDYKRYFNGKVPNKQDLAEIYGLLVTDLLPNYIEDKATLTLNEDSLSFNIELK